MQAGRFQMEKTEYITLGVALSLLGHILFVLPLLNTTVVPPRSQVFEIDFIPAPIASTADLKQRSQIVTEPEAPEEQPESARFLAEKSRAALTEQIKRGDSPEAGSVASPQPAAKTPPPAPPESREVQPERPTPGQPIQKQQPEIKSLSQLRLDQGTLIEEFASKDPSPSSRSSQTTPRPPSTYRAFSRPQGSGAMFQGQTGSPDLIPNLPDGDITLLNTKASQFAVFVRRVATQVFSQIRAVGWDNLRMNDIQSIAEFSKVRAVLSPAGELLSVTLESGSGSRRFDQVLVQAAQNGARDPNPPAEAAAADGNIHFIFLARSWVQVVPSGRSGAPTERRWLLLSTGLE